MREAATPPAAVADRAWSDADDAVLGGDLAAVLAYVTPAGGVVLTPVAPIGLRDRDAGTVAFTTSLGFGRKLERMRRDPRVALAYHAREHGFATGPAFALVQGRARFGDVADPGVLERVVAPAAQRFMGAPRTGRFWDWWLRAYYADRIVVTIEVDQVVSAPSGTPPPAEPVASQPRPRNGVGPRVDAVRAARRAGRLAHVLCGWVGPDGFPVVAPVEVERASQRGLVLRGALPCGGRRAGVLAHRFEHQLVGLAYRQHTGWLEDGIYAPHTERGLRAPANKTLLLLGNGFMARRGRRTRRAAAGALSLPAAFDPVRIGTLEARAWAAYYRREWPRFLRAAVRLTRGAFGLGPLATLRGSWLVLRANQLWAPPDPDNDPDGARQAMERFYRLAGIADPATAARLEVGWWRVHRAHQHGADDGEALVDALAALWAFVYGVPAGQVRDAARERATAMDVSDRWVAEGCEPTSPLLAAIAGGLVRSYTLLRNAAPNRVAP
jgi:hypothetical protein